MTTIASNPTLSAASIGSDRIRRAAALLGKVFTAFREATAAMQSYERQRARGVPHADAITRAFAAGYHH